MHNETILALDTATEACSVALYYQGNITDSVEFSPRTHTQRILPMIDTLLSQAGISIKNIDALAFGKGPGSFTGVRVAISVAQGLAFGANLPVIPLSNLTTMAQAAYQQLGAKNVLALIDARMNEVYFSQMAYTDKGWENIIEEQVCSPEKAIAQIQYCENLTVVGTGWKAYPQFARANIDLNVSEITLPLARFMLPLAQQQFSQGKIDSIFNVEPSYLRNEVTWQKLPHR